MKRHLSSSLSLLFLLCVWGVLGQRTLLASSPRFSLLTCAPLEDVPYMMYGHTALRVETPEGEDLVFNYGLFSFDQPHFLLNFLRGRPLYSVGVSSTSDFLWAYRSEGRWVEAQVLELEDQESWALFDALKENLREENRTYLYNFYYDNCATRPLRLIQKSVGEVRFPEGEEFGTFREGLRAHTSSNPWYTFGCDLCVGSLSDKKMTAQEAAFLPLYLRGLVEQSYRVDGRRLMQSREFLVPPLTPASSSQGVLFTPLVAMSVVLVLYLLLFVFFRPSWLFGFLRALLYIGMGVGGIVLWGLAFASSHPHTFPNLNMLLFSPLYLLLIPFVWRSKRGRFEEWIYFINFVMIVLYLLGAGLSVQLLPEGLILLVLLLMLDNASELRPFSERLGALSPSVFGQFLKKKRY